MLRFDYHIKGENVSYTITKESKGVSEKCGRGSMSLSDWNSFQGDLEYSNSFIINYSFNEKKDVSNT